MPSPVGHALGGVLTWALQNRWTGQAASRPSCVLLAGLAMAPDLDLLFDRHNGESHSLGAAALVALAVFVVRRRGRARAPLATAVAWALACGGAYASHLLLDALGTDHAPPIGIMAFWPVSATYVKLPIELFPPVPRNPFSPRFWSGMPVAVVVECLTLGLGAVLVRAWRRGK
ncbi:MAG: metal-dependent hydrolase [Vicinamibacterales bacterium]